MGKKIMVLLSGGIDSTVLLYKLRRERDVSALVVNYGQSHKWEMNAADAVADHAGIPPDRCIISAPLGGLAGLHPTYHQYTTGQIGDFFIPPK